MRPFHDPDLRHPSAPRLESDRLVLRAFELRDLDYFIDFFSNEEASAHVGGISGREDTWRRMLASSAHWPLTGIGMWAVEDKISGRTIGHVGFFDFLRDCDPSIAGEVEMGWILAPEAQGKGLAKEACSAILDWFDATFPATRMYALISPGNAASMRLAEKLGFERCPDGSYRDRPQTVWMRAGRGELPAAAATAATTAT
jgi:RimJ/RimL family protein N-acetyltransferase